MSTQRILLIGSSAKGTLEYSYLKAAAQLPAETMLFDPAVEEEKYVKGGKIGQKLHLFLPVESWIRKMNREPQRGGGEVGDEGCQDDCDHVVHAGDSGCTIMAQVDDSLKATDVRGDRSRRE